MILKKIIEEKMSREDQIFNSKCFGAGDFRVLAWCNEKIKNYKTEKYVKKIFEELGYKPETKHKECRNTE